MANIRKVRCNPGLMGEKAVAAVLLYEIGRNPKYITSLIDGSYILK